MFGEWRRTVRSLAKRRGLTLTIVATLGLSIGATTAIFAVLNTVILKPLPYPDAERLVAVFERNTGLNQPESLVATIRLDEWNRSVRSVEALSGTYFENVTDTTGPVPERIGAMRTAPKFFTVMGTTAALGRTFTSDEEIFGGPRTIVLSDALWRTRFGADQSVIGRVLTISGVPREVIGVMPPSFRYPSPTTEAWIPAQAPAALVNARQARFYLGVGRLKPGVTLEQAQDEISAVQRRLGEQFPETDAGWDVRLVPLKEQMIGDVRQTLWLLFGGVIILLLASCGNIAGLLLADGTRRELQVAIQFALGATRGAIIRQRMIEGAVLSLAGATCGLLVGSWGVEAIQSLAIRLPRAAELRMDARLIAFTISLGAVTTLAFALLPALHAASRDVAGRLAGHRHAGGRRAIQRVLVAAQVALAVVLLVGAGLLIRSFARLNQTFPGFDPSNVMVFRISSAWGEGPDDVGNRQQHTLERLREIPGVVDVALGTVLPAGQDAVYPARPFEIAGRAPDETQVAVLRQVSAGYFETMRMPLLSGEVCTDDPRVDAPRSVLVNQAFAERFFRNESPLGHHILDRTPNPIVGIVGNAREQSLLTEPLPAIYTCGLMPFYPDPWHFVRVDSAGPVTLGTIREAIREIEPQRAVYAARPLEEVLSDTTSQPRLNTTLFAFFGATAVVLVAVGLYGLLSQFVADRTREIGLRLALGAKKRQVLAQVVGQSAWITITGVGAGLAIAAGMARIMATLVFGISPTDTVTFVLVPLFLGAVMLVVTLLPAVRAASVDPIAALRQD
jgi:predicted permease